MDIVSLIEWCETDIEKIVHFKDRESLVKYVENTYKDHENWGSIQSEIVWGGANYISNCRGFALEVVHGELVD